MNASSDELNKIKHEAFIFIERQKQKLEDKIQKLKKEQEDLIQLKKEEKKHAKSNFSKREEEQIRSYNIPENFNKKPVLSEISENLIINKNSEEKEKNLNEVDFTNFLKKNNKLGVENEIKESINLQINEDDNEKDDSNSLEQNSNTHINNKSKDMTNELNDIFDANKNNEIDKFEKEHGTYFDNKENIVFQKKNFQIKKFKIRGLQQARENYKEIKEKNVNFNKIFKLESQILQSKALNNILFLEKTFKKLVFKKILKNSHEAKKRSELLHMPIMKNFSIKENTKMFLHDFAASLEFKPLESLGNFNKPILIHESNVEKMEAYEDDSEEEKNKEKLDSSKEAEFDIDEKVESFNENENYNLDLSEDRTENSFHSKVNEKTKDDQQNFSENLNEKMDLPKNDVEIIQENQTNSICDQFEFDEEKENDFEKDLQSENIEPIEFFDEQNQNLYFQECNDFEGSFFKEGINKEIEDNKINISFSDNNNCLNEQINNQFDSAEKIQEEQIKEEDEEKVVNYEENQGNKYISFTIADQEEELESINKWELKRKKKLKQLEERKEKLLLQETAEFGKTNNENHYKKKIIEHNKKTKINSEIPKTHRPISKNNERTNHSRNSSKIELDTQTNMKAKSPNNKINEVETKKTSLLITSKIDGKKTFETNNYKKRPISSKKFLKNNNILNITNAIRIVCLAGEPNKKERECILEKIKNSLTDNQNIILGFKGWLGRQDIKGIFTYDLNTSEINKIYGKNNIPQTLNKTMVKEFFRYDSGAKDFKLIPANREFSIAIDAVSLSDLFFRNK